MPVITILMFTLLGSPTVLLAIPVWLLIIFDRYRVRLIWIVGVFFTLGLSIFGLYQFGLASQLFEVLFFRVSNELFEEGTSLYSRFYIPYAKTIPAVLSSSPFLGVGYGNHNGIYSLFGFGGDLDPFESQFTIGTNAFANFVSYMGIVGATISFWATVNLSRQLPVRRVWLVMAVFLLLGQVIGTYSPPRFWCYVCLCIGSIFLEERQQDNKTCSETHTAN